MQAAAHTHMYMHAQMLCALLAAPAETRLLPGEALSHLRGVKPADRHTNTLPKLARCCVRDTHATHAHVTQPATGLHKVRSDMSQETVTTF